MPAPDQTEVSAETKDPHTVLIAPSTFNEALFQSQRFSASIIMCLMRSSVKAYILLSYIHVKLQY